MQLHMQLLMLHLVPVTLVHIAGACQAKGNSRNSGACHQAGSVPWRAGQIPGFGPAWRSHDGS